MRFWSVVFAICFLLVFPHVVFANNPDQPHSSLSSSSVPADGKTQAVITVTLLDRFGSPVIGHSVSISDPGNSSAGITTINGTTTSNGQVQFGITSNNPETDSLNVLDITTGSVLNGLGTVTFFSLVPTAAGYCANPAPASYPVLTSAVASGTTQITLTWLPAASPVTYYVLSFGTASHNYIYGNPNVGNVTTYTVGDLKPGTKYYFSIKPVNVCTPGPSSNELSAITLGGSTNSAPIIVVSPKPTVSVLPQQGRVVENTPTPTPRPLDDPTIMPESNVSTMDPAKTLVLDIHSNMFMLFLLLLIIVIIAIGVYWKHNQRKTFKLKR